MSKDWHVTLKDQLKVRFNLNSLFKMKNNLKIQQEENEEEKEGQEVEAETQEEEVEDFLPVNQLQKVQHQSVMFVTNLAILQKNAGLKTSHVAIIAINLAI